MKNLKLLNMLEVVVATLDDYDALKKYHYVAGSIVPATSIFKVQAKAPYTNRMPNPIAVIVFRMPIPDIRSRTIATNGFFHRPQTNSKRLKLVNKYIRYAARLVVDPRFRRLGVAEMLQREALARQTVPIVETFTPIDKYNAMILKGNFKRYFQPAPEYHQVFKNVMFLINCPYTPQLLPSTLHKRIDCLSGEYRKMVEREIRIFLQHYKGRHEMQHGVPRCEFILDKLLFPQSYYIWFNPNPSIKWKKPEDTHRFASTTCIDTPANI